VCWGVVPLYFNALAPVEPLEILAHRIVWSLLFLALLLTVAKRWGDLLGCLRDRAALRVLLVTTVLIAGNWFVYIYGVSTQQVVQTSLGYFINPLVNVVLGMIFLGERLRRLQWAAVALAAAGVVMLTLDGDGLPWIALTLGCSFGTYGLLRKLVPVDGLVGLAVETTILFPLAAAYLGWLACAGSMGLGAHDTWHDFLLVISGVVTTVPLLCFVQAARRLRLATLGFFQYLSPSLQFAIAVLVLEEPFDLEKLGSFVFIWVALALYTLDSVLAQRKPREAVEPAVVPAEVM
jgi:chloramphenicol-sensitive protein RarD